MPSGRRTGRSGLSSGLLVYSLAGWLALLLVALAATVQGQEVEPDHPFRFLFSTGLFSAVNENDARAAMKVWAGTLVREGTVRGDPNVTVCGDVGGMVTALQSRTVDGAAILMTEFFALRDHVRFNRYLSGVVEGSILEEYLILVPQESSLARIEDLKGHSLNLFQNSRMSLALIWLDTVLLEKGQQRAASFCSRVTLQSKLTKAVLPVLFRQADACLVTHNGFKTMGELNPQVSRQLRVLASSPKVVPAGFFFRAGYPQAQQDAFVAQLQQVHRSPAGQQVLTIFQTDRIEEHPPSVLNNTLEMLESHRRLCGETNGVQPSLAEPILGQSGNDGAKK